MSSHRAGINGLRNLFSCAINLFIIEKLQKKISGSHFATRFFSSVKFTHFFVFCSFSTYDTLFFFTLFIISVSQMARNLMGKLLPENFYEDCKFNRRPLLICWKRTENTLELLQITIAILWDNYGNSLKNYRELTEFSIKTYQIAVEKLQKLTWIFYRKPL